MKNLTWVVGITIIVLALIFGSASISAQDECGNCDNDGGVDIADLTAIIGYLYFELPLPIGVCDVDDYFGISVRDVLYLQDHLGINFTELNCPPKNPKLVATPDSSFTVLYSKLVPSGSVSMRVPIYLETPRDLSGIELPMRFRIGVIVPSIDSVQVTDEIISGFALGRIVPETGESVVSIFPFLSTLKLLENGSSPFHLANMFMTYAPSDSDRNLTAEWTVLSPVQAVDEDSTLIPALYATIFEETPAWEPALKSFTCGDVDFSGGSPDIADLTFLIDHLFINFPPLVTTLSGNIDGVGGIDISDLTLLIDHLFINFPKIGC